LGSSYRSIRAARFITCEDLLRFFEEARSKAYSPNGWSRTSRLGICSTRIFPVKRYKDLVREIERLEKKADVLRRKEVAGVITEIRKKMDQYGISADDLVAKARQRGRPKGSGAKSKAQPGLTAERLTGKAGRRRRAGKRGAVVPPKYRDPKTGDKWSGRGLTPRWLAEREKTGRKREEFLIKPSKQ
jgi:DNA-binding protein H-NS